MKLFSALRLSVLLFGAGSVGSAAAPWKIMTVGDSITAGADSFFCYRFALDEKLRAAGFAVEFVGTQTSTNSNSSTRTGTSTNSSITTNSSTQPTTGTNVSMSTNSSASPAGSLLHEGYGGKNTEYLAQIVPAHFLEHPAEIVLLHSGHNHSVEEKPVPGILAATESLIRSFREVNPHVTVLLAKVIPSGKLPKYAYIPDLNTALAELAARLDRSEQRVILVDQATGFDWQTDTVSDRVHPNAAGAEKMARVWFAALQPLLSKPRRNDDLPAGRPAPASN
jgi:hypothetical protein